MQTPRSMQLSILGKRTHRSELSSPSNCEQLQTPVPTPNPKRPKTTKTILDGDDNKENIPPYLIQAVNVYSSSPISVRAARALRRTSTEAAIASSRRRPLLPERRASTSSLIPPSTPIAQLIISTPPPTPPSLLPIHARARALLRATCDCIGDMPGRERERSVIRDFITTCPATSHSRDQWSSLYISGSPGTGKTALVNSLIQSLGTSLDGMKVVTVNCMALENVEALWERLSEELLGPSKRKRSRKIIKGKGKGRETLEDILSSLDNKCLLVLDELDHIAATSQSLSAVFSLPACNSFALCVIGIANTHTLTSSTASFSSSVQTLHFPPYTPAQLLLIVQARLAPLYDAESAEEAQKLLPAAPLALLTKKVAALTGDVRSLFEILRGAIDIAVTPDTSKGVQSSLGFSVTPAHILGALKAHGPLNKVSSPAASSATARSCSSEIATKVRSLGLQARLVLLSVLLSSKRTDAGLPLTTSTSSSPTKRSQSSPRLSVVPSVETSQLHVFYSAVLRRSDSNVFVPVSRSEFGDVVSMLEGFGLVSMMFVHRSKGGKHSFTRSTSFMQGMPKNVVSGNVRLAAGVWPEEVLRGMGIGASETLVSDGVIEEEVSALWRQELSRLERDRKNAEAKDKQDLHFTNATEDD
ncbi:P-loop containing nucleoside triphosphate hydrolase protein [Guyanagaster necrorhizus]|uniref:P-loop containing nucleoside triphosphate hydrolase protein n=1 Tax=Guyanagaster necrorhizus TaxID=856835 RepID=A0A9P7VT25_9AGAR|nr:P-loop containing nucleoside triphosphate hydrolase protein [Guyanagaster necrorhizus MCA 3950]KAG7446093.1 P-loop containing nucleoside triphosphate hydrolase protein [Guyanagaster necrorhizus MCA 3950]